MTPTNERRSKARSVFVDSLARSLHETRSRSLTLSGRTPADSPFAAPWDQADEEVRRDSLRSAGAMLSLAFSLCEEDDLFFNPLPQDRNAFVEDFAKLLYIQNGEDETVTPWKTLERSARRPFYVAARQVFDAVSFTRRTLITLESQDKELTRAGESLFTRVADSFLVPEMEGLISRVLFYEDILGKAATRDAQMAVYDALREEGILMEGLTWTDRDLVLDHLEVIRSVLEKTVADHAHEYQEELYGSSREFTEQKAERITAIGYRKAAVESALEKLGVSPVVVHDIITGAADRDLSETVSGIEAPASMEEEFDMPFSDGQDVDKFTREMAATIREASSSHWEKLIRETISGGKSFSVKDFPVIPLNLNGSYYSGAKMIVLALERARSGGAVPVWITPGQGVSLGVGQYLLPKDSVPVASAHRSDGTLRLQDMYNLAVLEDSGGILTMMRESEERLRREGDFSREDRKALFEEAMQRYETWTGFRAPAVSTALAKVYFSLVTRYDCGPVSIEAEEAARRERLSEHPSLRTGSPSDEDIWVRVNVTGAVCDVIREDMLLDIRKSSAIEEFKTAVSDLASAKAGLEHSEAEEALARSDESAGREE